MKNLIDDIERQYLPAKALVVYAEPFTQEYCYVECYDFDAKGRPINPRMLDEQETSELTTKLAAINGASANLFTPKGLMPRNVLRADHCSGGKVIWYTPPQRTTLYFAPQLEIESGFANVPALLWAAGNDFLSVYALVLKDGEVPKLSTPLYKAPFFNMYSSQDNIHGNVCMGTVNTDFKDCQCLEDFIEQWERAFWQSEFSHMIGSASPIKSNIVTFWSAMVNTQKRFPNKVLISENLTIKQLIL